MYRVNLDGTNLELIVDQVIRSSNVDPVREKIYWAAPGGNDDAIRRANLDGTNPEIVVRIDDPLIQNISEGQHEVESMEIDRSNGDIYWSDDLITDVSVWRTNYGGTEVSAVGWPDPMDPFSGGDGAHHVALAVLPDADFNDDGLIDCVDVDSLVAEIFAGAHTLEFDMTGDGLVDVADLDEWRVQAGAANLPSGNPYLVGDADLDGAVDGQDFIRWNENQFTATAAWCSGDFNAERVVDGEDFTLWNDNKFMSSDGVDVVPEPGAGTLLMLALIGLTLVQRR